MSHHQRCRCLEGHAGFASHGSIAERGEAQAGGRPFAFSTTQRQFERDRPFVVERLAATLVLDIPNKSVGGVATLSIARVNPEATELELDAVGFVLGEVSVDGAKVDVRYDGKTIGVPLPLTPSKTLVRIAYRASRGVECTFCHRTSTTRSARTRSGRSARKKTRGIFCPATTSRT